MYSRNTQILIFISRHKRKTVNKRMRHRKRLNYLVIPVTRNQRLSPLTIGCQFIVVVIKSGSISLSCMLR